jgi:DNA-binding CsgD family transcriptional regulator
MKFERPTLNPSLKANRPLNKFRSHLSGGSNYQSGRFACGKSAFGVQSPGCKNLKQLETVSNKMNNSFALSKNPAQPATHPPVLGESDRSAKDLSALIHAIYDATARPEQWPQVVETVARSVGADKGLLFTSFVGPQDGGFAFPWQIPETALQLWASKYIDHDIWRERAVQKNLWREGNVALDGDLVPQDELRATVFYREFLSTMQIGRACFGVVLGGAPGLPSAALSVFRDFDAPAFSEADRTWMRLLVPHLSRALGLMHRLDALHLRLSSLEASLDRLDFGVVLLGAHDKVLHLNAAAQRAIQRADSLHLDDENRLRATPMQTDAPSLADWLQSRAEDFLSLEQPAAHFSDDFVVNRAGGGTYSVQHSALPADSGWAAQGHSVSAVLFITDPAAAKLPDAARLVSLYGLTPAQAQVACALARGASYKQAARELNISDHTVASHVKEIYTKTRVNRQADLMRNIMALGRVSI